MALSFEARGLTLPPWRTAQAMASKWLPQRRRDTAVGAKGCGADQQQRAVGAAKVVVLDSDDTKASSSIGSTASRGISPVEPSGNKEGFSPTAAEAAGAAGFSPATAAAGGGAFSRIEMVERKRRSSTKGLLSDKLLGCSPTVQTAEAAAASYDAAAAAPSSTETAGSADCNGSLASKAAGGSSTIAAAATGAAASGSSNELLHIISSAAVHENGEGGSGCEERAHGAGAAGVLLQVLRVGAAVGLQQQKVTP